MISQKEGKQVSMDSCLLKLLLRDMTARNKRTKINQQTIIKDCRKLKNNEKVKAMGKITPPMDHYPRNI